MIICKTYNEAKLEAINVLSYFDNYPCKITIEKRDDEYCVDYEEFNEDECEEIE